jgi:hypothetical protein
MLEDLHAVLSELPSLVRQEGWQSLHVTYHPPTVERLWRQVGAHRVFLHRIHPCASGEALLHPHPWPSAVAVVSGRYEMGVAATSSSRYAITDGVYVPEAGSTLATVILTAGSEYEMLSPQAWHWVRPLDAPSLSVMVVGTPWKDAWPTSNFPKPTEPQTALVEELRASLLGDFQDLF